MPELLRFALSLRSLHALPLVGLLFTEGVGAASEVDRLVRKALAEHYVTALLLTDGESLQIGLINFNPNDIVTVSDSLGSASASAERRKLRVYSAPFNWSVPHKEASSEKLSLQATIRLGFVEFEDELEILEAGVDNRKDHIEDSISIGTVGAALRYRPGNRWTFDAGSLLHYLRYENETTFRNEQSLLIAPVLDGLITNMHLSAVIAEPFIEADYTFSRGISKISLFSEYHYQTGTTVRTRREAHEVKPEAWHFTNGVKLRRPFLPRYLKGYDFITSLSEIMIGADLHDPLGTRRYYQFAIGWVANTGMAIPLVENLGVSLNLNYGSDLKGGAITLLYNVD